MAIATQCSGCSAPLKLKDELAGKNIKCPRCGNVFRVPSENAAIATAPAKAPVPQEEDVPLIQSAPNDDLDFSSMDQDRGRGKSRDKVRARDEDRDEQSDDDEERPRRRKGKSKIEYEPCPKCEATGAERVTWTPWGSFYGPALLSHVRCPECGYAYNGKTGRSNMIAAIIFVTIPLLGLIGILGALAWYVHKQGYF